MVFQSSPVTLQSSYKLQRSNFSHLQAIIAHVKPGNSYTPNFLACKTWRNMHKTFDKDRGLRQARIEHLWSPWWPFRVQKAPYTNSVDLKVHEIPVQGCTPHVAWLPRVCRTWKAPMSASRPLMASLTAPTMSPTPSEPPWCPPDCGRVSETALALWEWQEGQESGNSTGQDPWREILWSSSRPSKADCDRVIRHNLRVSDTEKHHLRRIAFGLITIALTTQNFLLSH